MCSASAFARFALVMLCIAGPSRAAETIAAPGAPHDGVTPDALVAQRRRLQDAMEAAARAEADRRRTEGELESIRADRLRLSAALIGTTTRVRDAEERTTAIEARLDLLTGSEEALRRSLAARRTETAGVLAALQRMGLHPLPALLASPDDMLRAIRTSMLLGAAVPGLEGTAKTLSADLAELGRLRASIAGERDALAAETVSLGAERTRLADLVAARQSAQSAAEGTLAAERQRSASLALDAASLKDLVSRLEGDVAAARADAAGVAAKAALGTRDPARLAPELAFAGQKGRLTLPVAGHVLKSFGTADSYGGQERGLSLATRPAAAVTAPADGWVSFSGPYRSYGHLLIMNMGEGYFVVLAGLARADVVPGQFVLAGEPLGAMGDGSARTAAAIALGAGEPVLYVEFRKDGAAIDPSPWWAKAELQKVRG